MKFHLRYLFLLTGFLLGLKAFAQPYGNEWINYSQKYYQFKIVNEGIYRIDYQTLVNSGIDPAQFTSANMQIFGRDREQALIVFDGGDNSFNAGDYFLFYAERNDGWLDSMLYEDPSTIGNPGYSIFNDTINYFFTWNSLGSNLRYTVESDNNFANYTPLSYVLHKAETYNALDYNIGYVDGIQLSLFTPGEGYSSNMWNGAGGFNTTLSLSTPNVYLGSGAPLAVFHGKSNSNSNASAQEDDNHHLKWSIGPFNYLLTDTTFDGYRQIITNRNIPMNQLSTDGVTHTNFSIINDLGALTDYQSFSYMSLYYPRNPNSGGLNKDKFWIRNQGQLKLHVNLTNTSITSPVMLVHGSGYKYVFAESTGAGGWRALVSASSNGQDQKVIFQDLSTINTLTSLIPVNTTGNFTDFSGIEYDTADLIIYNPRLDSASVLYAAYRSLDYNVVYVNIDELYLQFGGGIPKHNAAIRRFALYAYDHADADSKPVALTLLGKGYSSKMARSSTATYNASLVPCFGHPGSDICYTANLHNSGFAPLIPTGRISVNTNTELANYLAKLISYEVQQNQGDVYNSENKDWQKQVLHFSGGNAGFQQDLFFSYMETFRDTIEDANYAGHVTTFRKVSSDPLDPALLGELAEYLVNGVSLMTFFGHSSPDGFDLTIDEPENWNNLDKYPVVVGNGCHSGDIYNRDNSFGEKLIRTPNEGAIAYIGSSDEEYDLSVFKYCRQLYTEFSPDNYGMPVGYQIQKTIEHLQGADPTDFRIKGTFGATNLDGDPLIRLNWHTKPEIEITEESIFFEPETIDLTVDTIELNLIIKNLGRAVTDTFYVEIRRKFPNSAIDSLYVIQYDHLNYIDTLTLKMPLQPNIAVGINTFEVSVDIPTAIAEQYDEEFNNKLTKTLFLKIDAIVPVYPYEFAVVPRDTVTVRGSTINPIGPERTYLFELDTTDTYDSPQKRVFSITGPGGVKEVKHNEWKDANGGSFPLVCTDSTVYFWRCAVDSSVLFWKESSFQYIKGKEGWGQDHFFQFKNNEFATVDYDRTNRKRLFDPVNKLLECDVYAGETNLGATLYSIDNQMQDYGMCWANTVIMAVIDPITLKPWKTKFTANDDGHDLMNRNLYGACRQRQEAYFIYDIDSAGLNRLNNALATIPQGYYILIYSMSHPNFGAWSVYAPDLFNTFSDMGATLFNSSTPNQSFIFYTQIGAPAKTVEMIATSDGELLALDVIMNSGDYEGEESSPVIGPSVDWKTVYWKQHPDEASIGDTTRLTIEMLNYNKVKINEIDTVFTLNDSIIDLGTLVPANIYPYIRLKAHYLDYVNFTPAQNDRWHVLFTPVPEAAIDGSDGYTWLPDVDTLNEGEEFKFAVDIKNISDYNMDSLLVSYWIEDQNRVKHPLVYARQDSLHVLQVLRDTISFSTTNFPGINSLWMEINPYVNGSLFVTDQPEQYHFNNLLQVPFYVRGDDVQPILDVTFDGRHILNGDIVSPESEIYITLKDDNEFLVMDEDSDTTLFGIYLTYPDGTQRKIPFMDGEGKTVMQWQPADAQNKRFKIIYPALFEQDGIYSLWVQGSDRSGNLSGDMEYRVSFEVIHESSITRLMNYPNPFSTSTRFVFTLTGSEIPEDFLIQIMTVSGKVVRQISEDELGPVYIGRNVTEFAWDGTDDFGDQLANGVYIYRVLSRLNGQEIKLRESGADEYFTKEYGKMYLIR
ncbi:MAG: C25 family cysteine peptidase [Bacteroidota bacterium]